MFLETVIIVTFYVSATSVFLNVNAVPALLSQSTTLNDRLILSTSDNYAYRTRNLTYTHN